jgi:hypothetical protein
MIGSLERASASLGQKQSLSHVAVALACFYNVHRTWLVPASQPFRLPANEEVSPRAKISIRPPAAVAEYLPVLDTRIGFRSPAAPGSPHGEYPNRPVALVFGR